MLCGIRSVLLFFTLILRVENATSVINKHPVNLNCHSRSTKSILDAILLETSIFKESNQNSTNSTVNIVLRSNSSKTSRNVQSEKVFQDYESSEVFQKTSPDAKNDAVPEEILTPKNLLAMIPPFDPSRGKGISEDCKQQSALYLKELGALKLWALKLYDSSAKIPSGFLNGNINQYGDMDQCMSARSESYVALGRGNVVKGKYCLVSIQLTLSNNASRSVKEVFQLVHSYHSFRSELTDPGHRVPRFSSINWGLCVPSGCSSSDVQKGVEHVLGGQVGGAGVAAQVLVEPQMCQVEQETPIPTGTIITGSIFIGIIIISLVATYYEVNGQTAHELVSSFSLKRNMKTLFSTKRSGDDIEAVHGIRCLNAIMLILSHKCMAVFFIPFINRTEMAQLLGQSWSVIGRGASLYTDPFIMFSGLLTCYSFLGRSSRGQDTNIWQEYLGRLFRIVPPLGALILFCSWVLPWLGSGPQWPLVITHHAHICQQHWWRNMLFLHNYFGFENMCLTHTHHIGIDTQLFAVGVPVALWLATRPDKLKPSVIVLISIAALATVARFYVSYTMELANFVHFGTSVSQLFRTADYMYILPAHRSTVYIMGLLLGLLLRHSPATRLTDVQLRVGWLTCAAMFLISVVAPAGMGRVGYQYSALPAAAYAAFNPITWCLGFGWIVYTQHHGYNSFIGRIFSWKGFVIWTRLSYAVYLTQFPVFFYYIGIMRTTDTYSFFGQMLNYKELIMVAFFSIVLTLLFDLPFQNIKNIICRPKQTAVENVPYKTPPVEERKESAFSESVAIVERYSNKKMWKAD